jgi:probable HAF family extracellular repeat protein
MPGAGTTMPWGINNKGQVVGYYNKEVIDPKTNRRGLESHGFLWKDGIYTTLDVPDSVDTWPRGINDSGEIVGVCAFRLSSSRFSVMSYPMPGLAKGLAKAIQKRNPQLRVRPVEYTHHNFLYTEGRYTMLANVPGSTRTQVWGINNKGEIVGEYDPDQRGFLLSKGIYTTLNPPGATGGKAAHGINDAGQIVGTFAARGKTHGYLLNNGKYTFLDVPGTETEAHGINNLGQIIPNGNGQFFLFSKGKYTALYVPGAVVCSALGINDAGQIVGTYQDKQRENHGFIATPTTEADPKSPQP